MGKPRDTAFLQIGVISRPHGILGEVKVHTSPEYLDALSGVTNVYLDDATQATRVHSHRIHQQSLLLRLNGINTRNDAEKMRGVRVSIKTRELPPLEEGQFYAHDLEELRVLDESGAELGTVQEVLATGSNDVYVVKQADGSELLLPAIESVIRAIDLQARTMVVCVPPGLRD
jgi:16S rRNA processing protein RimM